jgi:hypothetical protein
MYGRADGMPSFHYQVSNDGRQTDKIKGTFLNVKELFWVHAYNDLVDFVTDFRKNRGKPTKVMKAQLDTWSPTSNLERFTNEERVKWRRLYTISWLYDLVNLFSSIVVQRNTMKGEHHIYETVDWSTSGPWHVRRRLFGLNEFAGDITKLAMQKQGTDIKGNILPLSILLPRRGAGLSIRSEATSLLDHLVSFGQGAMSICFSTARTRDQVTEYCNRWMCSSSSSRKTPTANVDPPNTSTFANCSMS